MDHYEKLIAEAINSTDMADIAEVEDTMRNVIFHSTLDWQTRPQLIEGAKEAWEVVQIMRDPAALADALAE